MNYFLPTAIITVFTFLLSCSEPSSNHQEKTDSLYFDTSNITTYIAIIDSLKPNGYVPYFRFFKKANFDFQNWNISEEEPSFKLDSIAYYKARERFFDQDREFLNWLLSFKNDTVLDEKLHMRTLWRPFINPYLSTISPCSIITPKSRQAINLIYGILDGKKIACIECEPGDLGDHACAIPKYEYVELFLRENGDENIEELREIWKPI